MTLTQLNAFVLVARLGSVTAASPPCPRPSRLSGSTWVTSWSAAGLRA